MRLIKTFENEELARRFSNFLQKEGIENSLDVEMDEETKKFSYSIWVHSEDLLNFSKKHLKEFERDPKNKKFDVSLIEKPKEEKEKVWEETPERKKGKTLFITNFFLFLCVFIYFINLFQELEIRKKNPGLKYVALTPIVNVFLYDTPYLLMKVDALIKKYRIDPTKDVKAQPKEVQEKMAELDQMPIFRGLYEAILKKNKKFLDGKMFEKIREGQVWRVFTPCILHKGFLHILFNMLWLFILGKQIEARITRFKYILLILIVGIVSNTFQYLMSGPYFLGYSGVVMGMVGFIWSRQRVAPWEGYPLPKGIFLFLGIYVLLMFVLSFFTFITEAFDFTIGTINIANTAHISGAIVGWVLGRLPFFAGGVK
jgi:GlpG protein